MKMEKTKAQQFWSGEITNALKREKDWREQGDKVVVRYRDANRSQDDVNAKFNILWSNTEILKSATFSRKPGANVQRRYKDNNPVGRQASEVLERVLDYYSDESSFTINVRSARDDMLLPGRGTVWLQYEAEFSQTELEVTEMVVDEGDVVRSYMLEGVPREPDGFADPKKLTGPFLQELDSERVSVDYVFWKDFLHSNSRREEEVWWKARKHGMTVKELVSMFGEDVKDKLKTNDETDSEQNEYEMVSVWEIWSKTTNERIWVNEEAKDVFEREKVPLKLKGFFPCPKSIFPFETTDTMIPTPEFCIYQDQANQLDDIENRLKHLRKSLKAVGFYNGTNTENIVALQNLTDGQLAPVNTAAFKDNGGSLSQQIEWWPIQTIAAVMAQLEADRVQLKSEIYELTGISDIVRGSTSPNETASAQKLKGSFGTLRLRPRREPIEELVRDIYSIMAEIVADQFSKETMQEITGIEITEETMALLRDDRMRGFRIDVETDSTVQPNQALDQESATNFLTVVGGFFAQALPVAQQVPEMGKMMGEMIKFAANQFKAGRQLMPVIDETIEAIENRPQTQEQDPKAQVEQMKMQNEAQKNALAAQKMQIDAMMAQQRNETEMTKAQIDSQTSVVTESIKAEASRNSDIADIRKNQLDVVASRG